MSPKDKPTFDQYFSSLYEKRWITLRKALLGPKSYSNVSKADVSPYYIDQSSYMLAKTVSAYINTHNTIQNILDMCAAPGGKLIAILNELNRPLEVSANDISHTRSLRLSQNIEQNTDKPVSISSKSGSIFGLTHKKKFDLVLLDAPCSNERHVLNNPTHMKKWSKSRCVRDATLQTTLLCAAIDASSHIVVYSTCSLCPLENELLIERVMKKRSVHPISFEDFSNNSLDLKTCLDTLGLRYEEKSFGYIFLPDTSQGSGPLFVCFLVV